MNAYTTTGQAQIQSRDLAAIMRTATGSHQAAASLAGLERQRGWQAESEVEWLLKQHGVTPAAGASFVSLLWQSIGVALVCAGARLTGVSRSGVSPNTRSAVGTLGTTV
jgi:hypothetical protein